MYLVCNLDIVELLRPNQPKDCWRCPNFDLVNEKQQTSSKTNTQGRYENEKQTTKTETDM